MIFKIEFGENITNFKMARKKEAPVSENMLNDTGHFEGLNDKQWSGPFVPETAYASIAMGHYLPEPITRAYHSVTEFIEDIRLMGNIVLQSIANSSNPFR